MKNNKFKWKKNKNIYLFALAPSGLSLSLKIYTVARTFTWILLSVYDDYISYSIPNIREKTGINTVAPAIPAPK